MATTKIGIWEIWESETDQTLTHAPEIDIVVEDSGMNRVRLRKTIDRRKVGQSRNIS